MVTHDAALADRIPRKIEIVNGNIASDTRAPAITLWPEMIQPREQEFAGTPLR